jgi:hypothetical protein
LDDEPLCDEIYHLNFCLITAYSTDAVILYSSYEGGDIEPFDLFRWFVGGSTLEKMETEDGLQIYSQDLMKWEDKRKETLKNSLKICKQILLFT